MKRAAYALIITITLGAFSYAQREEKPTPNPEAGGIVIEPNDGQISAGQEITISFPRPMVGAELIDVVGQSPFISEPKIEGDFLWKSETEGVLTIRTVMAGARHHLRLAPGLVDASGKKFEVREWSAEFTTPAFSISTDFEFREHLPAKPQITATASYDVVLSEVAEHTYFQDRDSHERFSVEVVLNDEAAPKNPPIATDFTIVPREALPVGHTYDLIIDGLLDAKSRRALSYLQVFPAGKTVPLKVEWIGAFNHPLEEPQIIVKLNDAIDPAEATSGKVRIDPPLANQQLLANGDQIEIRGGFDLTQHYRVTISPELKGERGYGLTGEARWGATFRKKEPALIFPSSRFFVRARQELRFSFFQVNTPQVTWKLAQIPLEKLAAVTSRVREFERNATDQLTGEMVKDPRTGFAKPFPTELLVDAFALPVTASGTFDPTTDDKLIRRDLRATPAKGSALTGAYLLEATAQLEGGLIVGNRSIVCASEIILTQKRTPTSVIVRAARMSDAQPLANIVIRAVTQENIELARAQTDQNGIAKFARTAVLPAGNPPMHLFIAMTANGPALQFADAQTYASGEDSNRATQSPHAEIITDRNLYRPGQIVKMKGLMRAVGEAGLTMPAAEDVHWRVMESYSDHITAEGAATLSNDGGWEAEWRIPEPAKLGSYEIHCAAGTENFDGTTRISIEEYRVPLFSVTVEARPEIGTTAHAQLSSEYFHGAPNIGARVRWKATWSASAEFGSDEKRRYNAFSELGPHLDSDNELIKTLEGDAQLDARGRVQLVCESPFKDNAAIGRANVSWRAEVTSAEAQTLVGGEMASLFSAPARLGITMSEIPGKPARVKVTVDATDENESAVGGIGIQLELFHVTTKTVKEQIAPFVYRYRNTNQFAKVATQEAKTPAEITFPVAATGRYVAAARATTLQTPLVSDSTTVSGEEPAELPVQNETSFAIEHRKQPFSPGEKAVLSIQAPFAGTAWVSVETDEVLDTLLVPLAGNAGRIELPIKKEYAPNATVSIYLVRPDGEKELPRERFAFTQLEITRPDRELKIESRVAAATVKPGEQVSGSVQVSSQGKAVKDTDLLIFAVDDAVLTLGNWSLPNVLAGFYRANPFGVRSYQSLFNFVEDVLRQPLTQKGFVIGGGGEEPVGGVKNVRKEFRTLAFWNGRARTNANGQADFDFTAPDNLTTYRIVAVGQTRAHQFGGDAKTTVTVAKPLMVEPALPRFLRDGDELELRAVVREKAVESVPVTVRCLTNENCKLLATDTLTQNAQSNTPLVFRFKAKIADTELAPIKIRFEAVAQSGADLKDAVEITLPVQPPTIERDESVAGTFNGPQFDAHVALPENWKSGRGTVSTTISTLAWLPKIAGLPFILNYPHGCFEQISTRLLGYSLLANLLDYLPDVQMREAEYRAVLEKGMRQFDESILADGLLPYWPGEKTGHPFVTAQACWSLLETERAGFEIPPGLREKLGKGLQKILNSETPASSLVKYFALFVLTQFDNAGDFKAVSQDLYLRRNEAGDEGRAFLALALHQQKIMSRETEQLLREINGPIKPRAFDPSTFTSATRAEAIRAVAMQTIAPKSSPSPYLQAMRQHLLKLMDSSASLSTQENLWTLLAFRSFVSVANPPTLSTPDPAPVLSKNQRAALWPQRSLGDPIIVNGLNKSALTFLLNAHYSTNEVETQRVDRGFRVERVVRNLTNAQRNGTPASPFKLGDQILITYRVETRKLQNYVALEDALPAGLEIVNPNIAAVGKFFELPPPDERDRMLALSYSEMRDRTALLYFDTVDPGFGAYSVLARATTAGAFRWPATQVTPMYDSRFSGLSASSQCNVSSE